jgi:hypothetical protein
VEGIQIFPGGITHASGSRILFAAGSYETTGGSRENKKEFFHVGYFLIKRKHASA